MIIVTNRAPAKSRHGVYEVLNDNILNGDYFLDNYDCINLLNYPGDTDSLLNNLVHRLRSRTRRQAEDSMIIVVNFNRFHRAFYLADYVIDAYPQNTAVITSQQIRPEPEIMQRQRIRPIFLNMEF